MGAFDAVVIVDWSASSRPKTGTDSVWIGCARRRGRRVDLDPPENPSTRRAAEARVRAMLRAFVASRSRVLVGFDFPYGYPRGLARALGLHGEPPWSAIWTLLASELADGERNENDRFAAASALNQRLGPGPGPFWGCPPRRATRFLEARHVGRFAFPYAVSGGPPLERLRATERCMQGVQETWKLLGAGSVGSQALLGIPCVARLRRDPALADVSRVWPFETGFTDRPAPAAGPFVLHAEIWPGAVATHADLHPVRDAAQVLSLARDLATRDAQGRLGRWFGRPEALGARDRAACASEEGWILGAEGPVGGRSAPPSPGSRAPRRSCRLDPWSSTIRAPRRR